MDNKQELLDLFYVATTNYAWLFEKDEICRAEYTKVLDYLKTLDIETSDEDALMSSIDEAINLIDNLSQLLCDRSITPSDWITPKVVAENELIHENGLLTEKSIELLSTTIASKSSHSSLISDTGKTISFSAKWHSMLDDCGFKTVAVTRLTDFISKFVAPNGWKTYFVGNIGKNNKRSIQEYHVMDKYNLKHATSYAALHLGGDTTKCVVLDVTTGTADGRGEPTEIKFLEIGAHTIIDRFEVSNYKPKPKKVITEATIEELANLLEVDD